MMETGPVIRNLQNPKMPLNALRRSEDSGFVQMFPDMLQVIENGVRRTGMQKNMRSPQLLYLLIHIGVRGPGKRKHHRRLMGSRLPKDGKTVQIGKFYRQCQGIKRLIQQELQNFLSILAAGDVKLAGQQRRYQGAEVLGWICQQ